MPGPRGTCRCPRGSREALLAGLEHLAAEHPALATVTVTHHLEEIPGSATHGLLLTDGHVVARGALGEVLADDALSRCFGMPIELTTHDGRFSARARRAPATMLRTVA